MIIRVRVLLIMLALAFPILLSCDELVGGRAYWWEHCTFVLDQEDADLLSEYHWMETDDDPTTPPEKVPEREYDYCRSDEYGRELWAKDIGQVWLWFWLDRSSSTDIPVYSSRDPGVIEAPPDHWVKPPWGHRNVMAFDPAPMGSLEKCYALRNQLENLRDVLQGGTFAFDVEVADTIASGLRFDETSTKEEVQLLWHSSYRTLNETSPLTPATQNFKQRLLNLYHALADEGIPQPEWSNYDIQTETYQEPGLISAQMSIAFGNAVLFDMAITNENGFVTVSGSYLGEPIPSEVTEHPILVYNGVIDTLEGNF